MTDRGRGWIERLAGDSLRSQYRLAVVVVLSSLVLTSVISALSVIWANDVLQEQSERATTLKGVNASIRLDMADAETSLRGFGISGRRSALEMYIFAMGWLPQDQTRLRALADGHPGLERAVARQERAIDTWLDRYAAPQVEGSRAEATGDRLFPRGDLLFDRFRASNEEVDLEIKPEELRIDTMRAGGAGGQHVNKTESAVRILHIPTGIIVVSAEKSQHQNRRLAMQVLRSRLYEMQRQQSDEARAAERRGQVGSGDRSQRIRTYNFPQGRVTDHRINLTLHKLDELIEGGPALDEVIDALTADHQANQLAALAGSN